jgi:hypothetical protein
MFMGWNCPYMLAISSEHLNHGRMAEEPLTLPSLLSLAWPPNTRFGRVGRLSGLGPPEMGVGIGDGECAGEATRGFCAWMFKLP